MKDVTLYVLLLTTVQQVAYALPLSSPDHTEPEQNHHLSDTTRVIDGITYHGQVTQDQKTFLVQGDIIKKPQMMETRMAVRDRQQTWLGRTVPFIFKDGDYDDTEKELIRKTLQEMQGLTSNCVKFSETSESLKDYVIITKGGGCYSSVGRVGGAQIVSLAPGCLNRKGTIFHEMMHALGFWHEHNRPDRDAYIHVLEENILDSHVMDFSKLNKTEVDTLQQPYDLESVMHYSQWTFAKYPGRKVTFNLTNENFDKSLIGQRTHLSKVDINKIKALYECDKQITCSNPSQPANGKMDGVDGSAVSAVGTWITYTCNTDYTLIGPAKRLCKYNGTWTGFQPECVKTNAGLVKYCSFEDGFCDWKQDLADNFDWTRSNKRTDTEFTGPTVDNTYEGNGGHFLYMESSSPERKGQIARLISPDISSKSKNQRIKFFYHMFGDTMGTLNVSMQLSHSGAKKIILVSLSGNKGNVWHMAEKDFVVPEDTVYNIIVEGVVGGGFHSDIGIDDIIIKQIPETQVQVALYTAIHSCNFDASLCGWTQETVDESDWLFHSNNTGQWPTTSSLSSTRYVTTATSGDQQDDSDDYLFMKMSIVKPGGCAKLRSPILKAGPVVCAEFHYRMYGLDIGSLHMNLLSNLSSYPLWSTNRDTGLGWTKASVEISLPNSFQIEFKGVRGYGFYGEIAIDDVIVQLGKCVADLTCDFENDNCNWENDLSDDFNWLRLRGPTPTPQTGPECDHTSSRGYYSYIEASAPRRQGDKARLVSPVVTTSAEGCLTFWYHMYGSHIAHLRVFIRFPNGHTEYVWKLYGDHGKQWRFAKVPIRQKYSYRIVIEGEVGLSYQGDIALDDVGFSYLPCAMTTK